MSDREYQSGKATTAERLKIAEQMVKDGRGEDILFRDEDPVGTPVCATRFLSLAGKHGDDDMFSSDFTDDELKVCTVKVDVVHSYQVPLQTWNNYVDFMLLSCSLRLVVRMPCVHLFAGNSRSLN